MIKFAIIAKWAGLLLVASELFVPSRAKAVGTWTGVINAPFGVSQISDIMLLSDGSVMAQSDASYVTMVDGTNLTVFVATNWFQLSPDKYGTYASGGWKQVAPMHYSRNAYGLEILRDGRFLVVGDENDGSGSTAEVYDPVANMWTVTVQATVGFGDCATAMLPDGRVLTAPIGGWDHQQHAPLIMAVYDPVADSWSYP